MIRFAAPEWLVLLPFLFYAVWSWPRRALRSPLRAAALTLLVLALAEPEWPRGASGVDLWVLLDRSDSARDALEPARDELETLLERARPADGRLFVVDFAAEAQLRGSSSEALSIAGGETRLSSAVRFALGRADAERASRLLVISDGYATETLDGLEARLVAERVPLDVRLLTQRLAGDLRIDSVSAPARVQPGEPFLIEVRVGGESDGEVPVLIRRGGEPIGTARARVVDGRGLVRVSDRLAGGGAHRYSAELTAEDPLPGNDRGATWVEVAGGPRVLLLTAYDPDPVALALRGQGFEVEVVAEPRSLDPGRLAGTRLVFVNNVPAYALDRAFLEGVDAWVRVQGGGLLMAGGRWSFGAGGYFGSPLDGLLPVSMELLQEHRKLATALAIVMDRSGSMSASVAGGVTKMALANAGAARSLELLGEADLATVFAVDSEAHRVLPLARLGEARGRAIEAVRRISSAGGGIFVYAGLDAAWRELQQAEVGQRHVILFADAADAEEPGEYPTLVREMTSQGATLSVIGLGTPDDVDADLLMGLAALGNGRIFFSADPGNLPALFAQETVAVARSAFLEELVPVEHRSAEWREIAARGLQGLDSVDGYNLSYLREGASAALVSGDEYRAPLLSFWRRGAGRAAAVSFPLGGERSESVRAWSGYGDFVQTLARWLMADRLAPGIGLRSAVEGTQLRLELLFDDTWEERLARTPPQVFLAGGIGEKPREIVGERLSPGHFQASVALAPGQLSWGAIALGDERIPFGPLEVSEDAEWQAPPERRRELLTLAGASGGQELDDLRSAWRPITARAPVPLRNATLVAALLVFLGEALRSHLGWSWPRLSPRLLGAEQRVSGARPEGAEPPRGTAQPQAESGAPTSVEAEAAARRARRFGGAKWRARATKS
jgi:hypothetical protein